MSFNISHFTNGTNKLLTGGDIFDTFQADKTLIIIIKPAERLKAHHRTHSFTHMKQMNPHLTNKGSNPSPGAFNNLAHIV